MVREILQLASTLLAHVLLTEKGTLMTAFALQFSYALLGRRPIEITGNAKRTHL